MRYRSLGVLFCGALVSTLVLGGCQVPASTTHQDQSTTDQTQGVSQGTHELEGVTLTVPSGWDEEELQGEDALAPGEDVEGAGGFVLVDHQAVDEMEGGAKVTDEESMEALVKTVVAAQSSSDADTALNVSQGTDGVWRSTIDASQDLDGTTLRGKELILARGDDMWMVTALSPDGTEGDSWTVYQGILDSATVTGED